MGTAKQGLASVAVGRSDLFRIDPRNLKVKDGWNCRDDYGNIDELAASIGEVGVKEPLTVVWQNDEAWVTDGHRRLKATLQAIANGADIKSVPCKSEERHANDADRLFSQILRNSGKPFTALENAKVYQRLVGFGWTQSDIAKKAGISAARVSQVLELLTLPEPVKALVSTGQVSASLALITVKEHNGEKALAILNDAVVVAQQSGRVKAKPSDTSSPKAPKVSLKQVKDIIDGATVLADRSNKVTLTFSGAQFDLLSKLLKL